MQIHVNKKSIAHFVLLFFLIYPSFPCLGFEMTTWGTGTPVHIRIWTLLAFMITVFLYIRHRAYRKLDKPVLLYTGYMLIQNILLYVAGSPISVTSMLGFVTAFLATIYFFRAWGNETVDYFYYFFLGLLLWEIVVQLTPLNTPYKNDPVLTFIGHIQIYSMLWICTAMFGFLRILRYPSRLGYITKKRIAFYLALIAGTAVTLYTGVSASFIAIAVFLLAWLLFHYKQINIKRWLIIVFISAVFINIAVVFFHFQEVFAPLLEKLGEDTSLNGRDYIWPLFIAKIAVAPVFGSGYKVMGVDMTAWGWGDSMTYAHNTILQELMNGGLVQTILFLYMIFAAISAVGKCKNHKVQAILFSAFCAFFTVMIPESVTYYSYVCVIIAVGLNCSFTDDNKVDQAARPIRLQQTGF